MADDLDRPGDPPGEPGTQDVKTEPKAEPKPAPATFSADDVKNIVTATLTEFSKPRETPPDLSPDVPQGPTVGQLDQQIGDIDKEIDLAAQNEPAKLQGLIRKRDGLREQRYDLIHVAPLRTQGGAAINQTVVRQAELDPEFGDDFKEYRGEILKFLEPSLKQGAVLTLDVIQKTTALVVGQHIKDIREREREKAIRAEKIKTDSPTPTSPGRTVSASDRGSPQTVRERFGEAANEAFRLKQDKGMDENSFAKKMRFKDKADWFQKDDELSANRTLGLDKNWDPKTKTWVDPVPSV